MYLSSGIEPLIGLKELSFFIYFYFLKKVFCFCFISPLRIGAALIAMNLSTLDSTHVPVANRGKL